MNANDTRHTCRRGIRDWQKVLRPISWWIILVLILFTIRTHQILSRETCLTFDATIEGGQSNFILVKLDGNPISNGSQVPIGKHRITFTNRKAVTMATNVFVWYGGCDLGDVALKRSRGTLALAINPSARLVIISGPDFRMELTNTMGLTSSVPTDAYRIGVEWLNHSEAKQITIIPNHEGAIHCAPLLGALAILSEPAGARVIGRNGKELGTTPLRLREIAAGDWNGELRLDGYMPANASLRVLAHQTSSFRTNLVSWQYARAMEEAKRLYAEGDYERAFGAVEAALTSNNEAPDSKALLHRIVFARYMQSGQNLFRQSRYTDARQEIEAALRIEPDNAEAKVLLATTSKREEEVVSEQERKKAQELAERIRRERLNVLDTTMSSVTREHLDANFFDVQKLSFTNTVKELGKAIQNALLVKPPTFEVEKYNWMKEYVFVIEAKQQVSAGLRRCLIVGSQVGENESIVIFRVLEYETHLNLNLGGVLRVSDGQPPLVALPNRKDRVIEGIQLLKARIATSVN